MNPFTSCGRGCVVIEHSALSKNPVRNWTAVGLEKLSYLSCYSLLGVPCIAIQSTAHFIKNPVRNWTVGVEELSYLLYYFEVYIVYLAHLQRIRHDLMTGPSLVYPQALPGPGRPGPHARARSPSSGSLFCIICLDISFD